MKKQLNAEINRCAWAGSDKKYVAYHDDEWGVPVYDDRELFEMLILEGAQAGLSWSTILNKRESYKSAFDDFEPAIVADYTQKKIDDLLSNRGIVRNKLKIKSAVTNALAYLEVQEDFGSFSNFIWGYIDYKPIQNKWKKMEEIPAQTELSEKISKDLKARGFKFVGPTIVYAYMQSIGMVNDHIVDCFRYKEILNFKSGIY